MAITKYTENGVEYFRVYVHVRSKTNRKRRVQKYTHRLKTEADARREEKKLIKDASFEVQKIDGLGLDWDDVVNLWWTDVKAGYVCNVTEHTARTYFSSIDKWTKSWSKRPAAELTIADGRALLIRLEKEGLSRAYQKKIKNIINKVFEWGVEFGHIKGNLRPPLKGLLIDTREQKVPDILTVEEIKQFLSLAKEANHSWYPVWAFAIYTGMRSGELHALTWNQIDLEKNIIVVDRSYDASTKRVGPTKARYWRTVPINPTLRSLIIDLKTSEEVDRDSHVLPRQKNWKYGDQTVPLKKFLKSVNLKPIKFHTLRACFATQMLASGVSAPIVMKIGGWRKSATMDIYLRLAGVDTKGATDCLKFSEHFEIDSKDNVLKLFR